MKKRFLHNSCPRPDTTPRPSDARLDRAGKHEAAPLPHPSPECDGVPPLTPRRTTATPAVKPPTHFATSTPEIGPVGLLRGNGKSRPVGSPILDNRK